VHDVAEERRVFMGRRPPVLRRRVDMSTEFSCRVPAPARVVQHAAGKLQPPPQPTAPVSMESTGSLPLAFTKPTAGRSATCKSSAWIPLPGKNWKRDSQRQEQHATRSKRQKQMATLLASLRSHAAVEPTSTDSQPAASSSAIQAPASDGSAAVAPTATAGGETVSAPASAQITQ
jgi:hypothetical protein